MGDTTGDDRPAGDIRASVPNGMLPSSGSAGPPGIRVEASGFSLVGGTTVEGGPEPGLGAPTVHIRAFSLVGGVKIQRSGPRGDRGPRGDWRAERRDWRAERRAERRSRRGRTGYPFSQARASVAAH